MNKKVVYDCSVLVSGNTSGKIHKTGLFRVAEEILKQLEKEEGLTLYLYDTFNRERELVKYVQPAYMHCKRIHIYSSIYRSLIFPFGNLADLLRYWQRVHKKYLVGIIIGVLKITCLSIERLARKVERKFFIEKRLEKQFREMDVYYSTYFPIPLEVRNLKSIRKVYTLHDLIPILHPEYFSSPFNQRLVQEVVDSIGPKDAVIAVSKSTKNDLLKCRPSIKEKQVTVAHLAAGKYFYYENDLQKIERVKTKYGISGNYLLSLCTLEPRKNMSALVKAFRRLLEDNNSFPVKLVLTGSYGWNSEQVLLDIEAINKQFDHNIILTGYVPDEELAALYSGAKMFVFPSLYEGFGLPVLEAMKCGVPVIAANNSSLSEVAGNAAVLIDPQSIKELCSEILSFSFNEERCNLYRNRAIARANHFSWGQTAEKILQVF